MIGGSPQVFIRPQSWKVAIWPLQCPIKNQKKKKKITISVKISTLRIDPANISTLNFDIKTVEI
jgi:hypothetical protein